MDNFIKPLAMAFSILLLSSQSTVLLAQGQAGPSTVGSNDKNIFLLSDFIANQQQGADYYIAQNGKFVNFQKKNGTLIFYLKPAPFEIGANADYIKLSFALKLFKPQKIKIFPDETIHVYCFNSVYNGSQEPNKNELFIYNEDDNFDSYITLAKGDRPTINPFPNYNSAFSISDIYFTDSIVPNVNINNFTGTIYGYILIGRKSDETEHIMPIRLIFKQ